MTEAGPPTCRYVACRRPPSRVASRDSTARWPLCAVHRPLVREALRGADGLPGRVAVREVEFEPGDVRVLVGPADR